MQKKQGQNIVFVGEERTKGWDCESLYQEQYLTAFNMGIFDSVLLDYNVHRAIITDVLANIVTCESIHNYTDKGLKGPKITIFFTIYFL